MIPFPPALEGREFNEQATTELRTTALRWPMRPAPRLRGHLLHLLRHRKANPWDYPQSASGFLARVLRAPQNLPDAFKDDLIQVGLEQEFPFWLELMWKHVPLSMLARHITYGTDITDSNPVYNLAHRCVHDARREGALDVWEALMAHPMGTTWARAARGDGGTLWHTLNVREFGRPDAVLGTAWADAIAAAGVDPNQPNAEGFVPLMTTAIPRLMIERGANPCASRERDGTTVLHYQARIGMQDGLAAVLEAGADVRAVDDAGNTPLHAAVEGVRFLRTATGLAKEGTDGHLWRILALVDAGADLDRPNAAGVTPADLMQQSPRLAPALEHLRAGTLASVLQSAKPVEKPYRVRF